MGMYAQGASQPFGLMDLSGNVWEWTTSWYDEGKDSRVLRGGSWDGGLNYARVAVRSRYDPRDSFNSVGFRCVAPIGSGS